MSSPSSSNKNNLPHYNKRNVQRRVSPKHITHKTKGSNSVFQKILNYCDQRTFFLYHHQPTTTTTHPLQQICRTNIQRRRVFHPKRNTHNTKKHNRLNLRFRIEFESLPAVGLHDTNGRSRKRTLSTIHSGSEKI